MAGLITELIDLLKEQAACYDSLLTLADKKGVALIKNNVNALSEIVAEEQPIVSKVTRLERKRGVLVNDIGIVLNKNASDLTVKVLLQLLEKQPKDRDALEAISAQLKETIEKVRVINEKNATLINQSLDFVDYMMNFVQSSQSVQPPTYPSNTMGMYTSQSMFDRKQ